jgi:hypothetical protein
MDCRSTRTVKEGWCWADHFVIILYFDDSISPIKLVGGINVMVCWWLNLLSWC